jgi:tripartite-type tricarboxylate transporter receptor subunit TctC
MTNYAQCIYRRMISTTMAMFAILVFVSVASAGYPEKPIQFIIPFGAGGSADIEGRLLADEMGKVLGVSVVPVNKPGGGGAVTYTHVKNAKPDGYTMAWASSSILTSSNIGNMPFGYDALDHLGQVEYQPMPLAVKANAPWKTLKEFADYCKANPNKIKIANSGTGSATHLASIAMVEAIGCKVIHLPVGIKRRNATVLSGEAHAANGPVTAVLNLRRAKKLRLLAIPSAKRNRVIPDVPTATEEGYPVVFDLFRSVAVPKGTPMAIKNKLYRAMEKAAHSKAFKSLAKKKGFTIEMLKLGAFEAVLAREDAKVARIMKAAGLYQSKKK